ncbi:hypothetical protein F4561_000817 [Lipingzhangella halophila]|uniref:Ribbon-helix-helix CopG family protein n=1 Tax=Lipingzhangella halophila TaxID=1783352 RepID=A0A7W7W0K2_9ACTN|nr:CopG family transcriptional regulator [Lipingzhangella halophila]MBB4929997.1 hypothetical protein [Lipingzhangella halophila]
MALTRIEVEADPEDLALITEAAGRRGVSAAAIVREGIHLAAMANRVWDASLEWPTFEGSGQSVSDDEVTAVVAEGAADQ